MKLPSVPLFNLFIAVSITITFQTFPETQDPSWFRHAHQNTDNIFKQKLLTAINEGKQNKFYNDINLLRSLAIGRSNVKRSGYLNFVSPDWLNTRLVKDTPR